MPIFTPNTIVKLLNVPWTSDNINQVDFADAAAQAAYMESKAVRTFTDFTYARQDNALRVNVPIDQLYNCNYVMYKNANYSSRWFYAYIEGMEVASANSTAIRIKTDVFQTWQFDYTLTDCFVEREHVADDAIGANTVPEGLETGSYTYNSYQKTGELSELCYIIGVTDEDTTDFCGLYGNVYTGVKYAVFDKDDYATLTTYINQLVAAGKADAILYIFTYPKAFISDIPTQTWINYGKNAADISYTWETTLSEIDGYTPKNNKLFTSPFNQLYVTNNQGSNAIYQFENMLNLIPGQIDFVIQSTIEPNPTVCLIPCNYKNVLFNYEERLSLSGYPLCSWNNDVFASWFAQNKTSQLLQYVGTSASILGGAAVGNVAAVGGGAMAIVNQLSAVEVQRMQPDQARGNANGGGFCIGNDLLDFTLAQMSIKAEYARRIDNFFTMYGYKIGQVKTPNYKTRTRFNYLKTIGCNLKGAIPQDDLKELKAIFDSGVTIWHNANYIGDYTTANTIK